MCRRWRVACPVDPGRPADRTLTGVAMSYSILLALGISAAMIANVVFIIFYHDRKHQEIDRWVDYSFTGSTWRSALGYYRFMALSMLVFYVLFTVSCLLLQSDGYTIFADADRRMEQHPVIAGPIGTSLFTLDLVLRGGFFDIMEHFSLGITPVYMYRKQFWFVWYAFVFRMFFGMTMIKMLVSFVWIYGKARLAVQAHREARAAEELERFGR